MQQSAVPNERNHPVSTTTDQASELLKGRLAEINSERGQIEKALDALSSNGSSARRPGRPKGSTKRRRTRKGGPTRADQAVELVRSQPGIKASGIAKAMRIKPNYLYRVLDGLVKEKRLKKVGLTYELGSKETDSKANTKTSTKAKAKA